MWVCVRRFSVCACAPGVACLNFTWLVKRKELKVHLAGHLETSIYFPPSFPWIFLMYPLKGPIFLKPSQKRRVCWLNIISPSSTFLPVYHYTSAVRNGPSETHNSLLFSELFPIIALLFTSTNPANLWLGTSITYRSLMKAIGICNEMKPIGMMIRNLKASSMTL